MSDAEEIMGSDAPPTKLGADALTVPEGPATMRLDRWLWAARVFKTRSLASQACAAGHVKVNGASVKPAKKVRAGDRIEVTFAGGRQRVAVIRACAKRRGPASEARQLYEDHSPPPPPREEVFVRRDRGAGRPVKRERRMLNRVRGR